MEKLTNKKNNKIYWYLIVILWLLIVLLFWKNSFSDIQISSDLKSIAEQNLSTARAKVDRLNQLQATYAGQIDITKYITSFTEDSVIKYIYDEIENQNMEWNNWISTIRGLSLTKWVQNEIWFTESDIILNIRVPNEDSMHKVLDFFIKEDSKYKFFVESLTVPSNANSNDTALNLNIPLKAFYK